MTEEVWKDAKSDRYDVSKYQVSNLGFIRNKETKKVLSRRVDRAKEVIIFALYRFLENQKM